MKTLLFGFLGVFFLIGCDPGYNVYIHNNLSSSLYFKTHPSIESLYDSVHSSYYDSVVAYKIKTKDTFNVYKIEANQNFLIWSHIGWKPLISELPFDYIALINETDTTVLDTKQKIMEQIILMEKKRNYFIQIRK